jgi:hypothetical protein
LLNKSHLQYLVSVLALKLQPPAENRTLKGSN